MQFQGKLSGQGIKGSPGGAEAPTGDNRKKNILSISNIAGKVKKTKRYAERTISPHTEKKAKVES